jgi:hypothetical protein
MAVVIESSVAAQWCIFDNLAGRMAEYCGGQD